MKKLLLVILFVVLLSSCNSDPDVVEIPDEADIATCTAGDVYKYIYVDDIVYEFYFNDVLQNDDMLAITQTSVDTAGDVDAFLADTFVNNECVYTIYYTPK